MNRLLCLADEVIRVFHYCVKYQINDLEETEYFFDEEDAQNKQKFLKKLSDVNNIEVVTLNATDIEWLDGKTFTQEQLRNGELEAAIEMGQEAYEAMKAATDQSAINAWFLLKIAELTAELAEVKGNE